MTNTNLQSQQFSHFEIIIKIEDSMRINRRFYTGIYMTKFFTFNQNCVHIFYGIPPTLSFFFVSGHPILPLTLNTYVPAMNLCEDPGGQSVNMFVI